MSLVLSRLALAVVLDSVATIERDACWMVYHCRTLFEIAQVPIVATYAADDSTAIATASAAPDPPPIDYTTTTTNVYQAYYFNLCSKVTV